MIANTAFAIIASNDQVRFGIGDSVRPLSAFGSVMFAPIYAFLVLPVYAAASEYHAGQLRISLTAVPDRRRLAIGKFWAMVVVVVPAALVALVPGRLVLGLDNGLGAAEVVVDVGRWVTAYLLMSVLAFGLAAVVRSVVATLSVLVVPTIFVSAGFLQWPEGLRFLPDQAAQSFLGTPAFDVTELPPGIAASALLAWAVIATIAYVVALTQRDT